MFSLLAEINVMIIKNENLFQIKRATTTHSTQFFCIIFASKQNNKKKITPEKRHQKTINYAKMLI